jgi:hypothetical protein
LASCCPDIPHRLAPPSSSSYKSMVDGSTKTGASGSQLDLVMGFRRTENPSSPARGEYESTMKLLPLEEVDGSSPASGNDEVEAVVVASAADEEYLADFRALSLCEKNARLGFNESCWVPLIRFISSNRLWGFMGAMVVLR